VVGKSVTLYLSFLSAVKSDADLVTPGKRLKAFIKIDDVAILLSLAAAADTTISLGEFARGPHTFRYGVFIGNTLVNGEAVCLSI
jgi:hypothetical protein